MTDGICLVSRGPWSTWEEFKRVFRRGSWGRNLSDAREPQLGVGVGMAATFPGSRGPRCYLVPLLPASAWTASHFWRPAAPGRAAPGCSAQLKPAEGSRDQAGGGGAACWKCGGKGTAPSGGAPSMVRPPGRPPSLRPQGALFLAWPQRRGCSCAETEEDSFPIAGLQSPR